MIMPEAGLQFASALSTAADAGQAVNETVGAIQAAFGGPPDLVAAFYTHHFGPAIDEIPGLLKSRLGAGALVGCTGESIVGTRREVEGSPALSVWAARLPGVSVTPMHLNFVRTAEGPSIVGWPESTAEAWPAGAALVVLGEPFSFPADWLLERLAADRPEAIVCGGMASGAFGPGKNRVAVDDKSHAGGAAAVLLHGPIAIRTVVSQGCRPIGKPAVITKAEQQTIQEIGGRPPLEVLQEMFDELTPEERKLVNQGLHVGRVVNEYQEKFGRGDFLIRNVIGADRATGAMAVADFFRRGQTVQFHVRDAASADEDLRSLLAEAGRTFRPAGALLFTCNGRGTRMFDVPDHDAAAVDDAWPGLPVAGLFAQGELGPIGGRSFMHGFTASAALFGPA
jgi:small ligand-binding sensory domain FIST